MLKKIAIFLALLALGMHYSSAQRILLSENFSSAKGKTPPFGWTCSLLGGISKTDSFKFEDNKFLPIAPIIGKFASFDVYEGGYRGGSNGDNSTEDVVLESPLLFSDSSTVYIDFDYYFNKLRSPKFSLEITEDSGKSWSAIWVDSIGNKQIEGKSVRYTIRSSLTNGFKIRFRWKTFDSQLTQGYVIFDNILIYNKLQRDLGVNFLNNGLDYVYKNESSKLTYRIKNWGNTDEKAVLATTRVYNPKNDLVFQLIDTCPQIKQDQFLNKTFEINNLYELGTYRIVTRLNKFDNWIGNDSSALYISVLDSIARPKGTNSVRCGKGRLNLEATASYSDSVYWSELDNAKLLAVGDVFTTPELTSTDTFHCQTAKRISKELRSGQGPFRFNGVNSGGTYFRLIASKNVSIDRLFQHYANEATSEVSVYMKSGDYLGYERDSKQWSQVFKDSMTTSGWGELTPIDIPDQLMQKGDTLSFYIATNGNSIYTFKYYDLEIENPEIKLRSNSVNSRLFSSSGGLFTPYSWDGKVEYHWLLLSDYEKVEAKVVKRPEGSGFTVDKSFSGVAGLGDLKSPDQIAENGYASYTISSPNKLKNIDYGKTWTIRDLKMRTSNGFGVNDSFFWKVLPNQNSDLLIGFTPKGGWIDSTLVIELSVLDLFSLCDTSLERVIHISERPQPQFISEGNCSDFPIAFYNQTRDIDSLTHYWEFGDGTFDQGINAVHKYQKPGKYIVRLSSFNKYGIAGSVRDTIFVYSKPKALAEITHACEGSDVEIKVVRGKNGPETQYIVWTEGVQLIDSALLGIYTHQFNTLGRNTVRLIAQNEGCSDTGIYQAFQFPNPKASFKIEGTCQYEEFSFVNQSTILNDEKIGYQWRTENALFETRENFGKRLNNHGYHEFELIAISQFNCRDTFTRSIDVLQSPKSLFRASLACNNEPTEFYNLSKIPSNLSYTFKWDFGDGQISGDSSPTHYYNVLGEQDVALQIQASNGCMSTYDSSLIVRVQPNASFEVEDVCTGQEAVFVNFSRIENKILQYKWNFGDGDSSNIHSPRHLFPATETESYRVILEVFVEDNSCRDEQSRQVTVHRSPDCNFDYSFVEEDPLYLQFQAEDTTLNELTWSFEGGGFDFERSPKYRFQVAGTYLVRLYGKNAFGCDCRQENYISVGNVGIKNLGQDDVSIYPNPTREFINITANNSNSFKAKIVDISGKPLISSEFYTKSGQLSVEDLSPGVYVVSVFYDGKIYRLKFQKF